jgi:hypothetical protein
MKTDLEQELNAEPPPTFQDAAVQEAIDLERQQWEAQTFPLESEGREWEPLNEYPQPEDPSTDALGPVILNVMHNGAPALRQFNAGPAYSP